MIIRKTITATVAALTLGAVVAVSATPASAGWHHHGGGAFFGGLAAAALVGGVIAANSGPAYYGECYISRQPVTNRWGDVVGYRRVRVCE